MDGRMQGGVLKIEGIPSIIAHFDTPNRRLTYISLFVYYWLGVEFSTI